MHKVIGQSDIKHMTSLIETVTSVLKASTNNITNIPARPIIGLAEILMIIMSVSTFKNDDILFPGECICLVEYPDFKKQLNWLRKIVHSHWLSAILIIYE